MFPVAACDSQYSNEYAPLQPSTANIQMNTLCCSLRPGRPQGQGNNCQRRDHRHTAWRKHDLYCLRCRKDHKDLPVTLPASCRVAGRPKTNELHSKEEDVSATHPLPFSCKAAGPPNPVTPCRCWIAYLIGVSYYHVLQFVGTKVVNFTKKTFLFVITRAFFRQNLLKLRAKR